MIAFSQAKELKRQIAELEAKIKCHQQTLLRHGIHEFPLYEELISIRLFELQGKLNLLFEYLGVDIQETPPTKKLVKRKKT